VVYRLLPCTGLIGKWYIVPLPLYRRPVCSLRISTTSTTSSESPSSTDKKWFVSTRRNTTEAQFRDNVLSFLFQHDLKPYDILSSPALSFQQLMVQMNSSLASQIRQDPAVS